MKLAELVVAAERSSEHPLAKAMLDWGNGVLLENHCGNQSQNLTVETFKNFPGKGVECTVTLKITESDSKTKKTNFK